MKLLLSPQRPVNGEDKINYEFGNDIVTATYKGVTDTFDFSGMPDGRAENINTTLEVNPIISAERKDGVLYVKLVNYIGEGATDEEKFPDWQVIEIG